MNTIAPSIFAIILIFYFLVKLIVNSLHWGWGVVFVILVIGYALKEIDYQKNKKYK